MPTWRIRILNNISTSPGSLQDRVVDDAWLAVADADQENWLTYGRTYKEQRHSPLTQVNHETPRSLDPH